MCIYIKVCVCVCVWSSSSQTFCSHETFRHLKIIKEGQQFGLYVLCPSIFTVLRIGKINNQKEISEKSDTF